MAEIWYPKKVMVTEGFVKKRNERGRSPKKELVFVERSYYLPVLVRYWIASLRAAVTRTAMHCTALQRRSPTQYFIDIIRFYSPPIMRWYKLRGVDIVRLIIAAPTLIYYVGILKNPLLSLVYIVNGTSENKFCCSGRLWV